MFDTDGTGWEMAGISSSSRLSVTALRVCSCCALETGSDSIEDVADICPDMVSYSNLHDREACLFCVTYFYLNVRNDKPTTFFRETS